MAFLTHQCPTEAHGEPDRLTPAGQRTSRCRTIPPMSPRRAAAAIAAVVLAVGVILALTPLSAGLGSDEVACGSAYDPQYAQADVADIMARAGVDDGSSVGSYVAQCQDEVSGRRLVAYPLAGAGALVLLFVWLTGDRRRTRWDAEKNPADQGAA